MKCLKGRADRICRQTKGWCKRRVGCHQAPGPLSEMGQEAWVQGRPGAACGKPRGLTLEVGWGARQEWDGVIWRIQSGRWAVCGEEAGGPWTEPSPPMCGEGQMKPGLSPSLPSLRSGALSWRGDAHPLGGKFGVLFLQQALRAFLLKRTEAPGRCV